MSVRHDDEVSSTAWTTATHSYNNDNTSGSDEKISLILYIIEDFSVCLWVYVCMCVCPSVCLSVWLLYQVTQWNHILRKSKIKVIVNNRKLFERDLQRNGNSEKF